MLKLGSVSDTIESLEPLWLFEENEKLQFFRMDCLLTGWRGREGKGS